MRRLAVTVLIAALLAVGAPAVARQDDGPWVRATDTQRAIIGDALAASPSPDRLVAGQYFLITFDTAAKGVGLPEKLRRRFPDQMTVILQYDYAVVSQGDDAVTLALHFDDQPTSVTIPFDAVTAFRIPPLGLNLFWDDARPGADLPAKP